LKKLAKDSHVAFDVEAGYLLLAKSALYKKEFDNFANLCTFVQADGQKGVQKPVLPPPSVRQFIPWDSLSPGAAVFMALRHSGRALGLRRRF